jgi:hypothetical protein
VAVDERVNAITTQFAETRLHEGVFVAQVRGCIHGQHQLDESRAPASGARAVKENLR